MFFFSCYLSLLWKEKNTVVSKIGSAGLVWFLVEVEWVMAANMFLGFYIFFCHLSLAHKWRPFSGLYDQTRKIDHCSCVNFWFCFECIITYMEQNQSGRNMERYPCSKHCQPIMTLTYWFASCTQTTLAVWNCHLKVSNILPLLIIWSRKWVA